MLSKTHTKYIQSLQYKKFRDSSGLFIAEGPKIVMDLLNSRNFVCKEIIATTQWLDQHPEVKLKYPAILFLEAAEFELKKVSSLTSVNEVLAVFEKRKQLIKPNYSHSISLMLDTVQDPGNLGTIIRIADWFGVKHIICSNACADMYNAKVVQSTMGSLGRVNIVYTNLVDWIKENNQLPIYSASLEGKDVKTLKGLEEAVIIIGNESKGVSDELMDFVNEKITIPKIGEAESLNAAVATGIILSHL